MSSCVLVILAMDSIPFSQTFGQIMFEGFCLFFFFLNGRVFSFIISNSTKNWISMIGPKRDSFPILLMAAIHLATEARLWHQQSAPVLSYRMHLYSPFAPRFASLACTLSSFIHFVPVWNKISSNKTRPLSANVNSHLFFSCYSFINEPGKALCVVTRKQVLYYEILFPVST